MYPRNPYSIFMQEVNYLISIFFLPSNKKRESALKTTPDEFISAIELKAATSTRENRHNHKVEATALILSARRFLRSLAFSRAPFDRSFVSSMLKVAFNSHVLSFMRHKRRKKQRWNSEFRHLEQKQGISLLLTRGASSLTALKLYMQLDPGTPR